MIHPIIPPLHITELTHLQTVALANAAAMLGRHLLDLDGYVNNDELAEQLRFLGIAAAESVPA